MVLVLPSLTSESNWMHWKVWLKAVRSEAMLTGVWEYINPDLSNRPRLPDLPDGPDVARYSASGRAQAPSGLTAEERTTFFQDYDLWKHQRQMVDTTRMNYVFIRRQVIASVDDFLKYEVVGEDDVYSQLQVLSTYFTPTKNAYITELHNQWLELIEPPFERELTDWCYDWSRFLRECADTGDPDLKALIRGPEPILHWCKALEPFEPELARMFLANVEIEDLPSLMKTLCNVLKDVNKPRMTV